MDARHDRSHPTDPRCPPAEPDGPIAVRIRDVGEIAAALPHLLGFRPQESVVLLSLGGTSGRRVGLTVRADIPPPEHNRSLAAVLSRSLCTDHPEGAVVLVVSEAPDDSSGSFDLPHTDLVWEMCRALSRRGVPVGDTVLVRDGRWWSYDCPDSCCAPDAGTPLPAGVTELEVASIATGTVVAATREELVARLAPPPAHDREAMAATCARVGVDCSAVALELGPDAVAAESWTAVTAAVTRCRPDAPFDRLTDAEVARVVWALRDGEVRDLSMGLALGADPAAAEQLWTECTRRAPAPLDAAPATLLAVSAWLRGDGAMANVALAHALEGSPGYGLALLLADALAACVTPAELRAMLAETGSAAADADR